MSYKKEIELEHNEIPAKVNIETGEIKTIGSPQGQTDSTVAKFNLMPNYQRRYPEAWALLKTQTTDAEYKVADKLALMAKAYTNSLIPLNDDTTAKALSEVLEVSVNRVNQYIKKLFRLGVIGKFEVYNHNEVYTKYWVFNPYLVFNGNVIKKDTVTLFDGTTYALLANKRNN